MLRLFMSLAILLLIGTGIHSRTAHADPEAVAQVPTETPAMLNLAPVQQQQPSAEQNLAGATPTRTATAVGGALLEAIEFANVRAEPSTDSAQLGTIRAGETYNVIARYVSWIQFEFPASPTGRGWVFGELVTLSGNVEAIPEIDPFGAGSQLDDVSVAATSTQSILTQTPGGVLTATAVLQQGIQPGAATATPEGLPGMLPTFTFPPGMVAIAPTAGAAASPESTEAMTEAPLPSANGGVPPMMPILILGGLGLLGLLISALRRG